MFAGVSSSSGAMCPNTEMRRQDRRWDSEVRPVRCSTSSFRTRSYVGFQAAVSDTSGGKHPDQPYNQKLFLPTLFTKQHRYGVHGRCFTHTTK